MPHRIGGCNITSRIKSGHLLCRQSPTDCANIFDQLLLVACTNNDGGNSWLSQQPIHRHLRYRFTGLLPDAIQRVNDAEQMLVLEARPGTGDIMGACPLLRGLASAYFASQLSPA